MEQMKLMYGEPAGSWEETLPIGNGSLGAMIWGGITEEKLGLNEESIWSGYYRDKNNREAYQNLQEVRRLIFDGKCKEAERLIQGTMLGEYNESYLPLGNLLIRFPNTGEVNGYRRELSLNEAVAEVTYEFEGVNYRREYFASFPSRAIFVRLSADKPVLHCEIGFESMLHHLCSVKDGTLVVKAKCPEHVDPSYIPERPESVVQGERGMEVSAMVSVLVCDGTLNEKRDSIALTGASECVLMISAVREPAYERGCEYDELKRLHLQDYKKLYDKVELHLGEQPDIPTDRRLADLKTGKEDNGLYGLFFQYGRYLLIASSRKGSLPANLQGIWSWEMRAPWSSNWTVNINTQMNYWLAQSCNLEECLEPYYRFMERLCEEGKKTAAVNYHCRGFVVHHNVDYWCNTNPVGLLPGEKDGGDGCVNWAFWPMGGAWLTQELFRAYEYGLDKTFLKETAGKIIREAALFLLDWLVEYNGMYVTCPSTSPENVHITPEGDRTSVTIASTMDMTIVREVFGNYIKICEILELEDEILPEIREKLEKLAPFQTGSYGQLLEWNEEFEEPEPGHRHISHLYGLFPGELFAGDSDLEESCRISLMHRLENGGGHTGWSCAWIINVFAILGDARKAYEYLHTLLTRSVYPNLWDAHPPFQIDGNFGGAAAIANMLVQDRAGEVKILPALPEQFREGYVKGLCIKGRKAVTISWKEGKEVSHRIYDR